MSMPVVVKCATCSNTIECSSQEVADGLTKSKWQCTTCVPVVVAEDPNGPTTHS